MFLLTFLKTRSVLDSGERPSCCRSVDGGTQARLAAGGVAPDAARASGPTCPLLPSTGTSVLLLAGGKRPRISIELDTSNYGVLKLK